jgi:hypothetical protein
MSGLAHQEIVIILFPTNGRLTKPISFECHHEQR